MFMEASGFCALRRCKVIASVMCAILIYSDAWSLGAPDNMDLGMKIDKTFGAGPRSIYDLQAVLMLIKSDEKLSNVESLLKKSAYFAKIDYHVRYSAVPEAYCDNIYLSDDRFIVLICYDDLNRRMVERFSSVSAKKTKQDFEIGRK